MAALEARLGSPVELAPGAAVNLERALAIYAHGKGGALPVRDKLREAGLLDGKERNRQGRCRVVSQWRCEDGTRGRVRTEGVLGVRRVPGR